MQKLPGERIAYGGTVKRKCTFLKPPRDTTWTLEWILPDGTKTGSDLLMISNIQAKHGGRYMCVATHTATGLVMIADFTLRIRIPPPERKLEVIIQTMLFFYTPSHHLFSGRKVFVTIKAGPGNRVAYHGTLSLICEVTSKGWSLYWKKPNGTKVIGSHLLVRNLNTQHLGTYTCVAKKNGQKIEATYKIAG